MFDIVQPKNYDKTSMQTQAQIPVAKSREVTYPFQWLLFKPQLHAVEPFTTNKPSRETNTIRSQK